MAMSNPIPHYANLSLKKRFLEIIKQNNKCIDSQNLNIIGVLNFNPLLGTRDYIALTLGTLRVISIWPANTE